MFFGIRDMKVSDDPMITLTFPHPAGESVEDAAVIEGPVLILSARKLSVSEGVGVQPATWNISRCKSHRLRLQSAPEQFVQRLVSEQISVSQFETSA